MSIFCIWNTDDENPQCMSLRGGSSFWVLFLLWFFFYLIFKCQYTREVILII